PPGREVPARHAQLPQWQGALHRQDAEQLPPRRAHPPHAAERENHRHAARATHSAPNKKTTASGGEPMACCFGNLKQLFAHGQEFAYSVEDIARYYRTYLELMRHWDAVLPGRVLRVHYEDVVADLEGNVRRLLDYCGLAFEPSCVEFYKTERSV